MPKLLDRNPSYRRHKATGQAVVALSGRDFYLGPWNSAKSRAEYRRRIGEWHAAGGAIVHPEADESGVPALLAAFWRHAKAHYVDLGGQPSQEQRNFGTLIRRFRKAYHHDAPFGSLAATKSRDERFRTAVPIQRALEPLAGPKNSM